MCAVCKYLSVKERDFSSAEELFSVESAGIKIRCRGEDECSILIAAAKIWRIPSPFLTVKKDRKQFLSSRRMEISTLHHILNNTEAWKASVHAVKFQKKLEKLAPATWDSEYICSLISARNKCFKQSCLLVDAGGNARWQAQTCLLCVLETMGQLFAFAYAGNQLSTHSYPNVRQWTGLTTKLIKPRITWQSSSYKYRIAL